MVKPEDRGTPASAPALPPWLEVVSDLLPVSYAVDAASQHGLLERVAAGTAPATKQPTTQEIDAAVAAANANLSSSNRQLDYRVDAATGISIAMIRNSQTGVVVQQIPGADIIALARLLAEWAPGKHMLLDLIA